MHTQFRGTIIEIQPQPRLERGGAGLAGPGRAFDDVPSAVRCAAVSGRAGPTPPTTRG